MHVRPNKYLIFSKFHSLYQDIIRPLHNPIKKTGHIQTLYGNLAPDGSVAKITGKEGLYFSGMVHLSLSPLPHPPSPLPLAVLVIYSYGRSNASM